MTGMRGLLALLGLAAGAAELRAQVIVVPNPYIGGTGTGIYYTHGGHHGRLTVALTSYAPPGYSYGYFSPFYAGPYGYSVINQTTVVYAPPPLVPLPAPFPAVAPGGGGLPPFVGGAGRIIRLDDIGQLDPSLRADAPERPNRNRPLPGGREAGPFRPLEPDNRERAARPVPAEQPPPKPVAPPPAPRAPGAEPGADLPRPARPDADPKAESVRQLKLGRDAFVAGEYGRAIQFFRDAARATPEESEPYFLLAQGLFAAGRYPEAVDAIRVGLALRADWPKARFAPRDLYGPNAADFNDHVRSLRDALQLSPNDPALLFLLGYELWFDGRQEEARPLFQKARPRMADPAVVDRFLGVGA